jgi:histidine ammonia-lyase
MPQLPIPYQEIFRSAMSQFYCPYRSYIATLLTLFIAVPGVAGVNYQPITPSAAQQVITLTGHDLSIEQLMQVARDGAKVQLSPEAKARTSDAYGLLLEAAAEGVPVYWFNRGSGAGRQSEIFSGDPNAPANRAALEQRQLATFRHGAQLGLGPEISDEALVRAIMVIRANTMSYEAASPQLTQMLSDFINLRITPVVQSRGTIGEGDLGTMANIGAAMVGSGEAYFQGQRMSAREALSRAGLKPLVPFGADDGALTSTNAYADAAAAFLLSDAERVLEWSDLIYAIDLNGLNSSITPLSQVAQGNRPFKWLNGDASRILGLLKGSYLFDDVPDRIIQDPESMRASSIRQGSAWQAWAELRESLLLQINSSDHNPAVRVGLSPQDSWELNTPQLLKFYVKGGALSHGQHGYIVSNANWDPYPLVNQVEALANAMANMDVAIAQRINRFTNAFFTVVKSTDVVPDLAAGTTPGSSITQASLAAALMQEIQTLAQPVAPEGNALIQTVEDLQSQSRLKIARGRQLVADSADLLAEDLISGAFWLDVRRAQNPSRSFGEAATAAWVAFRQTVPFRAEDPKAADAVTHEVAARFLAEHPATLYYGVVHGGPPAD